MNIYLITEEDLLDISSVIVKNNIKLDTNFDYYFEPNRITKIYSGPNQHKHILDSDCINIDLAISHKTLVEQISYFLGVQFVLLPYQENSVSLQDALSENEFLWNQRSSLREEISNLRLKLDNQRKVDKWGSFIAIYFLCTAFVVGLYCGYIL